MKKLILLFTLICALADFSKAQNGQSNTNGTSTKPNVGQQQDLPTDKKTIRKNRRNGIYKIEKQVLFDFTGAKEVTIPKGIKTGDFYRVNVKNINLNNYRVELQVKDTVYYSKALDFPVFGSIDISGLEGLVKSFGAGGIEPIAVPQSLEFAENIPERIREFLVEHQGRIKKETEKLEVQAGLIDDERFEIMLLTIKAKSQVSELDLNNFKIESKIKAFEKIKLSIDGINKACSQNITEFSEFFKKPEVIDFFKGNIGPVTKLKQEKEKTEKAYSELSKSLSNTKSKVSTENVNKILTSVLHLYTNQTYTSLPIQFTGEEAEIKMSFIPKDSASNLQTYHLSPIKFGRSPWYWAVGPGMYYSRLNNERFSFETVQVNDSTQNFKVVEENPLKGEIGVSALFHAGRKFSVCELDLGLHLSAGTGISLGEEIQARFLWGGGVAIGKKNHLTIDAGVATGYVDRISNQVRSNGFDYVYAEKPDPLVKELNNKFFVSVGYMFSF